MEKNLVCGYCKKYKTEDLFYYDTFLKKRIRYCCSCYEKKVLSNKLLGLENLLYKRYRYSVLQKFWKFLPKKDVVVKKLLETFDGNIDDLFYPIRYNIDHIIPTVLFDKNNLEHVLKYSDIRNIRLVTASENAKKRSKIDFLLIENNNIKDLLP